MTGRGVDHILPHPCNPKLFEKYVKSAADYVALAEEVNGPVSKPVDFNHVWGDALAQLDRRRPAARLINLETAITTSGDVQHKGINYRMSPRNVPVITAARVDCCVLANNHVLDWGEKGLLETLKTLQGAGVAWVGAGHNLHEARRPAILPVQGGRVVIVALGSPTSGVPRAWAATDERPGINFLPDLTLHTVRQISKHMRAIRKPRDIIIVSLHWGRNWGYDISGDQSAFAHELIDEAGVDIVWGHSSHHPKAIEVHNGKLILYGCGDFLDDYEGIRGYEEFRDDLVLMYFPDLRLSDGALQQLTMVPLQIRKFCLNRASQDDTDWIFDVLNREGKKFGTRVRLETDKSLTLEWE